MTCRQKNPGRKTAEMNVHSSNPKLMPCVFTNPSPCRFHAYAVVMEMEAYEPLPTDPLTSKANILLKRKTFGGIPPGAGVREDVVLLFEELEEARNNLQQLEILIERTPEPSRVLTGES